MKEIYTDIINNKFNYILCYMYENYGQAMCNVQFTYTLSTFISVSVMIYHSNDIKHNMNHKLKLFRQTFLTFILF